MKFADIIAHNEAIDRLREMADTGRVPHALMLAGPAGIGKMRLARAFVQYMACTDHRNGDSCGRCPSCRQIEAFNSPDVNYVYPILKRSNPKRSLCDDYASEWHAFLNDHSYMPMTEWMKAIDAGNSQPTIYVDESAEILRKLSLSAYGAGKKVMMIWQPEKLQPAAANKLLKIIEEPSEDTVFILVSNEPGLILPTILSRTQTIRLRPLSAAEIAGALVDTQHLDPAAATAVARLAEGSYSRALENIGHQEEPARFRELFQETMRAAYARNVVVLRQFGEEIAAMGRDGSQRFFAYMAAMLRENFIYNLHNPELNILSPEEEGFSRKFSPFVNSANVEAMTEAVSSASSDIMRNANAKIVCFDTMLTLMMQIRKR